MNDWIKVIVALCGVAFTATAMVFWPKYVFFGFWILVAVVVLTLFVKMIRKG